MATFKATVRVVRTDGFMQVYIRVCHYMRYERKKSNLRNFLADIGVDVVAVGLI